MRCEFSYNFLTNELFQYLLNFILIFRAIILRKEMRELTQNFATSLLDHARTSLELEIMLNYNPYGDNWEPGERQTLDRLKLAIKYKQKQVT